MKFIQFDKGADFGDVDRAMELGRLWLRKNHLYLVSGMKCIDVRKQSQENTKTYLACLGANEKGDDIFVPCALEDFWVEVDDVSPLVVDKLAKTKRSRNGR